jgi:hypothetical protein
VPGVKTDARLLAEPRQGPGFPGSMSTGGTPTGVATSLRTLRCAGSDMRTRTILLPDLLSPVRVVNLSRILPPRVTTFWRHLYGLLP